MKHGRPTCRTRWTLEPRLTCLHDVLDKGSVERNKWDHGEHVHVDALVWCVDVVVLSVPTVCGPVPAFYLSSRRIDKQGTEPVG